jgi:hypothetical protein
MSGTALERALERVSLIQADRVRQPAFIFN